MLKEPVPYEDDGSDARDWPGRISRKWALLVMFMGLAMMVLTYPTKWPDPNRQMRQHLWTVQTCLQAYANSAGHFPSTSQGLRALTERPEVEPLPKHWQSLMEKVPRDRWGREFVYLKPGIKHPNRYDLYSLGQDGKPNTEDDIWP